MIVDRVCRYARRTSASSKSQHRRWGSSAADEMDLKRTHQVTTSDLIELDRTLNVFVCFAGGKVFAMRADFTRSRGSHRGLE
jgi:hypothetical protein